MFRERVLGVLVKIEGTSGVDANPVPATDAVRLANIPVITYGYLESGNRDDVVVGQLGRIGRAAPAGNFGSLTVRLEARGSGAAYNGTTVFPEVDRLLGICGLGSNVVTTPGIESVTYSTVDTGIPTATCYAYTANKLIKLVGCVANFDLTAEALKRGFFDFTITGRVATAPTEVALPSQTFNATVPALFHTQATTIGSYSSAAGSDPLVLRSVALHLGNTISDRPSAGATDGLIGYVIVDRIPRQEMKIEVPLLASYDAFAKSKLATAHDASTWQIGSAQYNRMKVTTGQWAIEAPGDGADRSIKTWDLQGNLVMGTEGTSGREFKIVFD